MNKHDLRHDFPELEDKIHQLKVSDTHFRRLFDEYHEVNQDIHSIESGATVTTDERLNDLRLKRVHLKDELYQCLQKN